MKILIADDERDICEAVRRIVERAGHTCIEVYDGALALEAYERERPDLVVLDVMMPEVNGFDLCRDLRAKDARVPIIMLSAKSDIVDKGVGLPPDVTIMWQSPLTARSWLCASRPSCGACGWPMGTSPVATGRW